MDIPSGTTFQETGQLVDKAFEARDLSALRALRDYYNQAFENTRPRRLMIEWVEAKIELIERGGRTEHCDIDSIQKKLISEYGYSPGAAEKGAYWLINVSHPLQDAVLEWWGFNRIVDLTIHELSLKELVERFGYTLPAAIAILDAMYRHKGNVAIGPISLFGDPFNKE